MASGNSDVYLVIRGFMLKELKLKGLALLLYARIYGFCEAGAEFYESRASTAKLLNSTERSVTRAMNELVESGLVELTGARLNASGKLTKCYRTTWPGQGERRDELPPLTKRPTPDKTSGQSAARPDILSGQNPSTPEEVSGQPVTGCHPIRKGIRKPYG